MTLERSDAITHVELHFAPPQVEIRELNDNGLLLNISDLHDKRNIPLFSDPDDDNYLNAFYYPKKGNGLPFGVLELSNEFYAVYSGSKTKALGEGAFGKVKLVQNLKTGEWGVLKTQLLTENLTPSSIAWLAETDHLNKQGMKEFIQLQKVNQAIYHIGLKYKKNDIASHQMLMKFAPGINLNDFNKNGHDIRPARRIDIAMQLLAFFHDLFHNKGIVHRDIKGANIVIDVLGNVRPVDFGLSQDLTSTDTQTNRCYQGGAGAGSPKFMAPEIQFQTKDPSRQVLYNEATEIYALGVTLQDWFGFSASYEVDPFLELQMPSIYMPDEKTRNAIATLIQQMTNSDPNKRPSMQDAYNELNRLLVENHFLFSQTVNACIVTMSELIKNQNNSTFIDKLKTFDQIILANDSANIPIKQTMELIRKLEKKGITVNERIFCHPTVKEAIEGIPELLDQPNTNNIYNYYALSNEKQLFINPKICPLHAKDNNKDIAKKMQEHLMKLQLSPNDFNKILQSLNRTLQKVTQDPLFTEHINRLKGHLDHRQKAKKLTYQQALDFISITANLTSPSSSKSSLFQPASKKAIDRTLQQVKEHIESSVKKSSSKH